jgi:hypothetical protein
MRLEEVAAIVGRQAGFEGGPSEVGRYRPVGLRSIALHDGGPLEFGRRGGGQFAFGRRGGGQFAFGRRGGGQFSFRTIVASPGAFGRAVDSGALDSRAAAPRSRVLVR